MFVYKNATARMCVHVSKRVHVLFLLACVCLKVCALVCTWVQTYMHVRDNVIACVCVCTGSGHACAFASVSMCVYVHECIGVCVRVRGCVLMSIFVIRMQINNVHLKTWQC